MPAGASVPYLQRKGFPSPRRDALEFMLDIIRVPIGYIIDLCYRLIPNYAIALLFFALIMKILLFPFGIKQQKNMVRQAKLRPKEQAIRARYAGRTDKVTQQKMQQDIMKLYQDEKFNPASGCLPMIIQVIIVFALYAVVINPLHYVCHIPGENINNVGIHIAELYAKEELDVEGIADNTVKVIEGMASAIGEDGSTEKVKNSITGIEIVNVLRKNGVEKFHGDTMLPSDFTNDDLPDFTIFGGSFDLSKTPNFANFDWLMLIPLLTFVFTFASMKLTKKLTYQPPQQTGDAALSMKMMDYVMPLVSTFFTFTVPAVVAVYWIYQNIFSTVQQFVLKLMYPYPVFTEEDYKAAEREMNKGIRHSKKAEKKKSVKSAHRIDLEDGEEPEEDREEKAALPKAKSSGLVPPAALKDESDKDLPD